MDTEKGTPHYLWGGRPGVCVRRGPVFSATSSWAVQRRDRCPAYVWNSPFFTGGGGGGEGGGASDRSPVHRDSLESKKTLGQNLKNSWKLNCKISWYFVNNCGIEKTLLVQSWVHIFVTHIGQDCNKTSSKLRRRFLTWLYLPGPNPVDNGSTFWSAKRGQHQQQQQIWALLHLSLFPFSAKERAKASRSRIEREKKQTRQKTGGRQNWLDGPSWDGRTSGQANFSPPLKTRLLQSRLQNSFSFSPLVFVLFCVLKPPPPALTRTKGF